MKIAVIGPVPPFRSGVAKHTGEVAKALAAHGTVRTVSFARQYPGLLFPGEDDRDPDTFDAAPEDTEYALDSISPLNWRKLSAELKAWAPDIAIIPAWTFFTAPALTYLAQALRKQGARVISIVHNAADHEGAGWKRALLSRQIQASDSAITHNRALAQAISAFAPDLPVAISPHPLFAYPEPIGSLARRARLELLMFGLIRPYKGADLLVEAMGRLAGQDMRLTIAGEVWGDKSMLEQQIAKSPARAQIELVARYLSDAEAAEYFARADSVVLPYRQVTGSGVVPVALHYGKPVIASDLAGFREIVTPGETGWLVPAEDSKALASCLEARLAAGDTGHLAHGIAAARAGLSWSHFVQTALDSETAPPAWDYVATEQAGASARA
ncbi:MAG: glycosyltransferase [Hyphomonadaceae bacterium]|nr:glycosyltransferase [Hyphomonadaceae bacterium]